MNHSNFSKKKFLKQTGAYNNADTPESNKVSRIQDIPATEEWEKQLWFYRSHLDVFIEDIFSTADKPIRLFPFQKVIARATGNCQIIDDVEARSLGKTFKMALILIALAILYPYNKILIVSKTVRQAMLTIKYIESLASDNPNISREIIFPIRIQKDMGTVKFKSGTVIEALAMNVDGSNIRGLRKKVVYIDESAWVKTEVIQSVLMPILQYKRDIFWKFKGDGIDFEDVESKLIQTTSAYLKTCDFYTRFKDTMADIKNGDKTKFACSLSYKTGVRYGIIDEAFVESQKLKMPLASWEMEWNSRFIGSTDGSYFPYDLTEPCRKLEQIEVSQAKGSKSRYILSCDIATSAASYADNACICVLKISEKSDGTFNKFLVNIRSFHGQQLEILANEIRKMCVRFPNIEKVLIDVNALGEGIVSLLNTPFVDDLNKEYPPFILDTLEKVAGNALPIIRGIRADNKYNAKMATATRLFLENKSLQMPVSSQIIRRELELTNDDKGEDNIPKGKKIYLMEESAIFIEADALQYEMGNIIPKITVSGNIQYDTPSAYLHKDRYTALAMGLCYVYEIEEGNRNSKRNEGDFCIGTAYSWV